MHFNAARIYEDFSLVLKPGTPFLDYRLTDRTQILSLALIYHALHGRDAEKDAFRASVMEQEID